MIVLPQVTALYLWTLEMVDNTNATKTCVGRIVGWAQWTGDYAQMPEFCPVVADGFDGKGAHARVVDTSKGFYWTDDNPEPDDEADAEISA